MRGDEWWEKGIRVEKELLNVGDEEGMECSVYARNGRGTVRRSIRSPEGMARRGRNGMDRNQSTGTGGGTVWKGSCEE